MYVEFVNVEDEYEVILGTEMEYLPQKGDTVSLGVNVYSVNSIEWVPVDQGNNSINLAPIVYIQKTKEYKSNQKYKKLLEETEDWYAVRFEALKDWAKKNNHKEFFDILANGSLLHEPPTYAQKMNILKNKLSYQEKG